MRANPYVVFTVDDTVECLSVEGQATVVEPTMRARTLDRALPRPSTAVAPDLSADFIRQNLVIEVVPERAFAVIEREEEFATRATRWVFDD